MTKKGRLWQPPLYTHACPTPYLPHLHPHRAHPHPHHHLPASIQTSRHHRPLWHGIGRDLMPICKQILTSPYSWRHCIAACRFPSSRYNIHRSYCLYVLPMDGPSPCLYAGTPVPTNTHISRRCLPPSAAPSSPILCLPPPRLYAVFVRAGHYLRLVLDATRGATTDSLPCHRHYLHQCPSRATHYAGCWTRVVGYDTAYRRRITVATAEHATLTPYRDMFGRGNTYLIARFYNATTCRLFHANTTYG